MQLHPVHSYPKEKGATEDGIRDIDEDRQHPHWESVIPNKVSDCSFRLGDLVRFEHAF